MPTLIETAMAAPGNREITRKRLSTALAILRSGDTDSIESRVGLDAETIVRDIFGGDPRSLFMENHASVLRGIASDFIEHMLMNLLVACDDATSGLTSTRIVYPNRHDDKEASGG